VEGVTRPDIETRDDCERLVRAFYAAAFEDPMIGYLFTDVARLDLESHVPRITSFWETVLLGNRTYAGGAFGKHAELHAKSELREGHFERWLQIWFGTVDAMFAGDRANLAKVHALRVARAFHGRLQSFESAAGETYAARAGDEGEPAALAITYRRQAG
jgi:hemoglobin